MGRVRALFRKLLTLGGTPAGIAGGFTLGVCLSLVPIPFAGMVVALALAPLLRCNLPATYIGTAIVNPFTGAAFYFAELWLGMTLLGMDAPSWASIKTLDAAGWLNLFIDMLGPFAFGAVLTISAAALICYPAVLFASRGVQSRRAAKKRLVATTGEPEADKAEEKKGEAALG